MLMTIRPPIPVASPARMLRRMAVSMYIIWGDLYKKGSGWLINETDKYYA